MFEKAMGKSWTSIEFLRWSQDVLGTLTHRTNQYVQKTGQFSFSQYLDYFNKLKDPQYSVALKNFRIVAAALTKFDYDLLCDYQELVKTLAKGMKQIAEMKAPKNIPEQIAYRKVLNDAGLISYTVEPELYKATSALRKHYDSWRLVDRSCPPFGGLDGEMSELKRNINLVLAMEEK